MNGTHILTEHDEARPLPQILFASHRQAVVKGQKKARQKQREACERSQAKKQKRKEGAIVLPLLGGLTMELKNRTYPADKELLSPYFRNGAFHRKFHLLRNR